MEPSHVSITSYPRTRYGWNRRKVSAASSAFSGLSNKAWGRKAPRIDVVNTNSSTNESATSKVP